MLSRKAFELQPGSRTAFGVGSVEKLGKRLAQLGKTRALVVTDAGLTRAGVSGRIAEQLRAMNVSVEIFDGVHANPSIRDAEQGAEALRALPDAAVVALGGGSSMDAAKAIALAGVNPGGPREFVFGCKPERPGAPIVAVPTTAGTGSETNMFGVVTDPALGRKILIGHPSVQPVAIFLDPALGVGVPPVPTATCGMDVLTHAMEALSTKRQNPYSSALALSAIGMTARFLARAFDDGSDLEARSQMLLASHFAGLAFTSSGLGICHAMGHPVSARFGAAHGQTLATLLPHVMRFNLDVCADPYAEAARALGVFEAGAPALANAERAIDAVEALSCRVGTNRRAADLGVTPEAIPMLIEDAFADALMAATPKPATPEDVERLYRAAL